MNKLNHKTLCILLDYKYIKYMTLSKVSLPAGSLYLKGHEAKALQVSREKRTFATYWP